MESQTGDIQAMSPAMARLLAARTKEEREAAERGPGEMGHAVDVKKSTAPAGLVGWLVG